MEVSNPVGTSVLLSTQCQSSDNWESDRRKVLAILFVHKHGLLLLKELVVDEDIEVAEKKREIGSRQRTVLIQALKH